MRDTGPSDVAAAETTARGSEPAASARGVRVARSIEEVEQWRDWWQSLDAADVDADIDYFLTVVRTDPAVVRPHVMRVAVPGHPPVLVVARIADEQFRVKVSGARLGSVRAPALVVSFEGLLGATTDVARRAAHRAIRDQLAAGEADAAVLQKTPRAGGWFRELTAGGPSVLRLVRPPEASWTAQLPQSWDALLGARSSKSRKQIRFDDKKLRRIYGDRLVLRRLDLPEHQDRLIRDVTAVAATTYQRGLGVSMVDGPVQQALFDLALAKGWLRVWMLYIDDRPVAFWWGVNYAGVLSIGSPGYVPAYAKDRVGYYTLRRMLEDSANDPATHQIDFGTRDADYKERFGDRRNEVSDVLLFARRPRALTLHAFLRAEERLLMIGRVGLARAGRADQIRQWWRERNLPAAATANAS